MHEVKITVLVQQHRHLSVFVMPGLSRGAEAPVLEKDHWSAVPAQAAARPHAHAEPSLKRIHVQPRFCTCAKTAFLQSCFSSDKTPYFHAVSSTF